MDKILHRCIKRVDNKDIVKNGKTSNGKQRYKCKHCGCTFLKKYSYNAYLFSVNTEIVNLLKEGVGIRSMSRLLNISTNIVLSRLIKLSKEVQKPMIVLGKRYETNKESS